MEKVADLNRVTMLGDHLPLWRIYISAHDWANALRICERAATDDDGGSSGHALLHITHFLSSLVNNDPDDEGLVAISESLAEENYEEALARAVRLDPGEPDSDRWRQVAELSGGLLHFLTPPRLRLKERVERASEQARALEQLLKQAADAASPDEGMGEVGDQVSMVATALAVTATKLWEGRPRWTERAGIVSEYRWLAGRADKVVGVLNDPNARLPKRFEDRAAALKASAGEIKTLVAAILVHLDRDGTDPFATAGAIGRTPDALWKACGYDVDNLALRQIAARQVDGLMEEVAGFEGWLREEPRAEDESDGADWLGGSDVVKADDVGWLADWGTAPSPIPSLDGFGTPDGPFTRNDLADWLIGSESGQHNGETGQGNPPSMPEATEGHGSLSVDGKDAADWRIGAQAESPNVAETSDAGQDSTPAGSIDSLWRNAPDAGVPAAADEPTVESPHNDLPMDEGWRTEDGLIGWDATSSPSTIQEVSGDGVLPSPSPLPESNGNRKGHAENSPAVIVEDGETEIGDDFHNQAFDWYVGARSRAMGHDTAAEPDESLADEPANQPSDGDGDGWNFAASQVELAELLAAEKERKAAGIPLSATDWSAQPDAPVNGQKVVTSLKPAANPLLQDPGFQEGLSHFQRGDWDAALASFSALQVRYPQDAQLTSLLSEAELRAKVDRARPRWSPRRVLLRIRRWLGRTALIVVAVVVLFFARQFYIERVVPQQQIAGTEARKTFLLEQGRTALASANYDFSLQSFEELLQLMPGDPRVTEGIAETNRQMALLDDYRAAVALQEGGHLDEALAAFRELDARSSGYRDIATRMRYIERIGEAELTYQEAEAMREAGQWEEAIQHYKEVQALDASYLPEEVNEHLFSSYLKLGRDLLLGRPSHPQQVEDAVDALSKALVIHPQEPGATAERDFARTYLAALSLYDVKQWEGAISGLRWIYNQRPDYLGGLVAEQLYHAYLSQGDLLVKDEQVGKAYEQYVLASRIGVPNVSEAERKAAEVGLLLTPTPTPTVTPTPLPTPTASPTFAPQQPLATYRGRIAFWSNRDGRVGVWIMNPDGSNVFEYRGQDVNEEWQALWETESFNPESTWKAFVDDVSGVPQIYYFRNDVPETWERRFRVTDAPGSQYDPAWSPTGDRIAYVSNQTGNDEIWIINPDGTDARRLTRNTWEWDKHPSWSPDGARIAFWSNRDTGRRQIYVMQSDGSHPTNISNNEYDDWDPIWIK